MMRNNFRIDKTSQSIRRYQSQGKLQNLNNKLQTIASSVNNMGNRFESFIEEQRKEIKQSNNIFIKGLMEERDQCILINPPLLSQSPTQRQKQIKVWLGEVTKHVFSVTFNFFKNKILRTQRMKAYCSESMINNIINLSKENTLTSEDFQLINKHLSKQLLPYYLKRYPQSENKQINQSLMKQIEVVNSLDTNENNFIMKSQIQFKYREDQNYGEQIMKFLNYIISVPQTKLQQDKQSLTLFESFEKKMKNLFTSVFDRVWTETDLYAKFKVHEDEQQLKKKSSLLNMLHLEKKSLKLIQEQNSTANIDQINKGYQENVKSYTSFDIGQKISKNVPLISNDSIKYGNIKITDPSLLRIMIKWCGELQKKFIDPQHFLQRDQTFLLMNGKEAEMITSIRRKLCKYAQDQWKQICKFHQKIEENNFKTQRDLSYKNLITGESNDVPSLQSNTIKFAGRITENTFHYASSYLNRLIHGLMKISKNIYDSDLRMWAQWPCQPQLLTFCISDLMRCRCFSKQKEIIRIYKELQIITMTYPQILRIARVKNRLNRGTRDILLNIVFHEKVICQIQLAIKSDVSPFILYSDKYNHYIYELKRSIFGPVSQMCSIWRSRDERANCLKGEKIHSQIYQHNCQLFTLNKQMLPFICNECEEYYSQRQFIIPHLKCEKCQNYWKCAKCQLKEVDHAMLKNFLEQRSKYKLGKVVQEFGSQFPEFALSYKFQSLRVRAYEFRVFFFQTERVIVSFSNGKPKIVFTYEKGENFLKKTRKSQFIIIQNLQPSFDLVRLTYQDVEDLATLNEIQGCYQNKAKALRITDRHITKELLLKIKDVRSQAQIKTLSFPLNEINEIKGIAKAFPKVKILNLNKNSLQSLEGIGKMKKLTDVYLAYNKFTKIVQLDCLQNLSYIQLGDNANAPTIECDLSKLKKLQSLTFISSNLTAFPTPVCFIENLKLLWLFNNKIDKIPKQIKNLKKLETFKIDMNYLKSIPDQLSECNSLKVLDISLNCISQIPSSILKLEKLQQLNISGNPHEKYPSDILDMPSLKNLIVDETFTALDSANNSNKLWKKQANMN